ncbi:asparagine synthase-related protein [Sphingomonas sp.]|jgi:asparagine synthase (glutamine-hydrolysing)|uniref:asparagine synthase-related protein n=1 Tax=Sphingomonas sp. TaxID=28214 RepID=UPI003562DC4F
MSAIFGLMRFDGATVADADVARMGRAMAGRTPDGRAVLAIDGVGLGHGLMRVVREDAFDQQPLYDRDSGLILVADLRLDNREELAAALDIHDEALVEMPDSALLLHAYRAWGEQCPERLIGDFAFAIWDARAQRLMLARDHMGQRQLYFHHGDGFFAFATEPRALWTLSEVPRALDPTWLAKLATKTVREAPSVTAFTGIRALLGGTIVSVERDGRTRERRYWEPRANPADLGQDLAYYQAAYRRVLQEAVECRLRRLDRAPGLLFSGGFDSAAVAGLAGAVLRGAGRKIVAAASVMPTERYGENGDARPAIEQCLRHMPHLEVHYVDGSGMGLLDGANQAFEESGILGLSLCSESALLDRLAARGVRQVLDGHGGDYTINPRVGGAIASAARAGRFRFVVRELRAHRRRTGLSWPSVLWNEVVKPLLPARWVALWDLARRGFMPVPGHVALTPMLRARFEREGDITRRHRSRLRRALPTARDYHLEVLRLMQNEPGQYLGSVAGARGMELTKPFHDKRVAELACAIPLHFQLEDGKLRKLARIALQDIYPPEFQHRGDRQDSHMPYVMAMAKLGRDELISATLRLKGRPVTDRIVLDHALEIFQSLPDLEEKLPARESLYRAIRQLIFAYHIDRFELKNRS